MLREMRYLREQPQHRYASMTYLRDWDIDQLSVVFAFNCFYQIVLGPLESASRKWKTKAFSGLTIAHGNLDLDPERAKSLRVMINQFDIMMNRLTISPELLSAATTSDVLFRIERRWREEHGETELDR